MENENSKGRQKISISRDVLLKPSQCCQCRKVLRRGSVAFMWHIQGQQGRGLVCPLCIASQLSRDDVEISVPV